MTVQLRRHIVGQTVARVVHGAQDALNLQLRVNRFRYPRDGAHQRRQALQGKVLTLHGDYHAIGRHHGIERQHIQRRGTVDEHVVVSAGDLRKTQLQALLLVLHLQQLHFRRSQVAIGWQNIKPGVPCPLDCSRGGHLSHQHIVDAALQAVLVDATTHGRIALRVQIDQQHPLLHGRQRCCEVYTGRGFAHTTLLVGYRNNSSH